MGQLYQLPGNERGTDQRLEISDKRIVQIRNIAGLSSPDSVTATFTNVMQNEEGQADITLKVLSCSSSEKDKIDFKEGDEVTVTLKHEKGQIDYYYEKDGNYANGEIYPYQMEAIMESLNEEEKAKLKEYLNIDTIDRYALPCKEAVGVTRNLRKEARRADVALAA